MESIGEPRRLFQDRHLCGAEVCIASCWWRYRPGRGGRVGLPLKPALHLNLERSDKITEERLGRASLPFFLRPFPGCVPQPEKKRRLFDSHKSKFPHGCRVGRHYIKASRVRESLLPEKQRRVSSRRAAKLRFRMTIRTELSALNYQHLTGLIRRSNQGNLAFVLYDELDLKCREMQTVVVARAV